jgi:hypothetical protein
MKILFLILVLSCAAFGQSFSTDWQKVPAGFTGNDFNKIYDALKKTPVLQPKGEFETTADYQKRTGDVPKISFGENLNASSNLVFIYKTGGSYTTSVKSKYDADKEILEGSIELKRVSDIKNRKTNAYLAVDAAPLKYTKFDPYEGQNGYGTKVTIEKSMMTYYNLAIANIDSYSVGKESYSPALKFSVPLPLAKAKETKENLSVLYVGKLVQPLLASDADRLKPTIDKPRDVTVGTDILVMNINEIWVFNDLTGEILTKIKPKK